MTKAVDVVDETEEKAEGSSPGSARVVRRGWSKRRRMSVWVGCMVAALAAAAWFLVHEPQLTDHAARVTNVTNYAWINNEQLLWAMPNSAHLMRLDLRTRKQHMIESVNALADKETWKGIDLVSVAPGGQRVLSNISRRPSSIDEPYDGRRKPPNGLLDLQGRISRELDGGVAPAWLPDGRRWLGLAPENHWAYLYAEDTGQLKVWLYSADAPSRKVGPLPTPKGVKTLLGVTPDSQLVMTDHTNGVDAPWAIIWHQGVYLNNAPERRATIDAPSGWSVREAALSPTGDRIAMLLASSHIPPLMAFIARVLPGLVKNVQPAHTFQIRTYRIDGTDNHEVGFQDSGNGGPQAVSNIKWNPDGKRISFVYRDSLYIVPSGR